MAKKKLKIPGHKSAPMLSLSQYNRMRREVLEEQEKQIEGLSDKMVVRALSLSMLVLHDKFGFGHERLTRFFSSVMTQVNCIGDKYVTIDELIEILKRECKIEVFDDEQTRSAFPGIEKYAKKESAQGAK